jgi:phospholipase C
VTLPASASMPRQEAGRRPARALPYDLAADGRITGGALHIAFASRGSVGANFVVTSTVDKSGPWSYTVDAGQDIAGSWKLSGPYDYDVRGANGFLREFKGDAAKAGLDVVAEHVGHSRTVKLTLTNTGPADVTVTITDSYGCDGRATHRVRAGKQVTHVVHAADSDGWYDATVTSDHDAAYVRRFAGHVENGRPSASDPAIITG